jgi:hypothetical protein
MGLHKPGTVGKRREALTINAPSSQIAGAQVLIGVTLLITLAAFLFGLGDAVWDAFKDRGNLL